MYINIYVYVYIYIYECIHLNTYKTCCHETADGAALCSPRDLEQPRRDVLVYERPMPGAFAFGDYYEWL